MAKTATPEAPKTQAPPRPMPPAATPRPAPPLKATGTATEAGKRFEFRKVERATAHRIGIYGSGGIGKTTLACLAPGPVAFFDLDDSLDRLSDSIGHLDVRPIKGIQSWKDLRTALAQKELWDGIKTIVIDSATKAEEFAVQHVVETVTNDKGAKVSSVEGYGYGKGYQYVMDAFLPFLGDCDNQVSQGRNIILICHEITATVPNPTGEDFIRWEPRLQSTPKASIRMRLKEWCDHLLFVGYDVMVTNDGKAKGSGTRTIYPTELPTHMAKSRTLREPIPYEMGEEMDSVWRQIFQTKEA